MHSKNMIAAVLGALAIGTVGGWWFGSQHNHTTPAASTPATERKVLYWYDPMKPEQHFDKPGKSPFMDMELVPRYADDAAEAGSSGVRIDPVLTQNTGVKLARVTAGTLASGISVPASVAFNDRDVAIVQARTGGIVERAYPVAMGDVLAAGAPLADLRVPEWLAAQNEYLALRHDAELGTAALARLRQLGMSPAEIARLQKTGQPHDVVTITAPRSGMVAELSVRQGMVLTAGSPLARINGLATVWLEAEVPEAQAATVRPGDTIQAVFAAWPNAPVAGKVTALIPELNKETRSVRVRAQIPNQQGLLRPGMFAQVALNGAASQSVLLVPSDSVIATGKRSVVIVADGNGRFTPAEVKTGREHDGQTEIVSGLHKDEQIVVSGQFLVDSEATLRGVLARMNPATASAADHASHAAAITHSGTGIVKAVAADGQITLTHEPIASLKWPAMTMPFTLAQPDLGKGLQVGQHVTFSLEERDGEAVITAITADSGSAP